MEALFKESKGCITLNHQDQHIKPVYSRFFILNQNNNPPSTVSHCFVLFPGNPGCIEFYEDFFLHLNDLLALDSAVFIGESYLGHVPSEKSRCFSLEEQIFHRHESLHRLLQLLPNATFHLLGHSLGAHIMWKVLARTSSDECKRIKTAVSLFPMLKDFDSCASFGLKIVMRWGLRHLVCGTLALLPNWLWEYLGKGRRDYAWAKELFGSVPKAFSYSLMLNILYLTTCESSDVGPDALEHMLINRFEQDAAFFFTPDDHWAPPSLAADIMQRCPDAYVHADSGAAPAPHAFVLGHSRAVAKRVAVFYQDRISPPPSSLSPEVAAPVPN